MSSRWLVIAGIAGVGLYAYSQRKKATQIQAVTPGPPAPPPSFWDTLVGVGKQAAQRYVQLEIKTRTRGSGHYSAWKKAIDSGKSYYSYGRECFFTSTADPAPFLQCEAQELE